jgi:hypothetical protein
MYVAVSKHKDGDVGNCRIIKGVIYHKNVNVGTPDEMMSLLCNHLVQAFKNTYPLAVLVQNVLCAPARFRIVARICVGSIGAAACPGVPVVIMLEPAAALLSSLLPGRALPATPELMQLPDRVVVVVDLGGGADHSTTWLPICAHDAAGFVCCVCGIKRFNVQTNVLLAVDS